MLHPRLGALALLLCAGIPAAQAADEKITLKVADTLPTTHYISVEGAKVFMSRVTELTKGRVTFEYYPTEQLGKARDMLRLVQSGVTDIAYIAPSYVSEKMPMSGVAELPLVITSACQGTKGFYALAHDGILGTREFRPNGVVPLMAWSVGPYAIGSRRAELRSVDDFKGMKIRGAGGTWDLVLRAIGAAPVNFAPPEVREAMERGTIDGNVGPAISMKPYDLLGVTRSMTRGVSFGSIAGTYSMNLRKFRALPADIQAAFVQAGQEAGNHLCGFIDQNEAKAFDAAKQAGIRIWDVSPADVKIFEAALRPVQQEWAKALDQRQLPGSELLQAFQAAAQ